MNRIRMNLALFLITGMTLALFVAPVAAGLPAMAGEAGNSDEIIPGSPGIPTGDGSVRPDAPVNLTLIEKQVVAMVNKQRTKHGLAPLARGVALTRAARLHSANMRETRTLFFAPGVSAQNIVFVWPGTFEMPCTGGIHEIPNSGWGIAYCAMHLFMKHSACEPMNNAPRLTILDPSLTKIGVGVKYGLSPADYGTWYGYYITQNFA